MSGSLFDGAGNRKYLVARERLAFARAAIAEGREVGTFCLTLLITGARISEVLALTRNQIDIENFAIVFKTLKQRDAIVFRAIPVSRQLLLAFNYIQGASGVRIWPWGRTTAWKNVKRVMETAGIADSLCMPKSLRHGFAVDAGQNGVQLNIIQRWLGHARLETTAIYANVLGKEERALARRTWKGLDSIYRR